MQQGKQVTKLNQDRRHSDTSVFSTILGGVFGRFSGRSGIGSSSTSHVHQCLSVPISAYQFMANRRDINQGNAEMLQKKTGLVNVVSPTCASNEEDQSMMATVYARHVGFYVFLS